MADPAAVPICDEVPAGARSVGDGGTTLETLELEPGYYRTSNKSHNVLECFREAACEGGIDATDDGYCADGYSGPCESIPFKGSHQSMQMQGPGYVSQLRQLASWARAGITDVSTLGVDATQALYHRTFGEV